LDGASVDISVDDTDPVSVLKKKITIQADAPGFYAFAVWFADSDATPGSVSATPPDTTPGVASWTVVSDDTGLAEFEVENVGVVDTWYLIVNLFGVLNISEAITIGS
jgi:hypothetical protein